MDKQDESSWEDEEDREVVVVSEYELAAVVGDMTAVEFECNKGYRSSVVDIRLVGVGGMEEEDREEVEKRFNKLLDDMRELECFMDKVCEYTDKL